MEIFFNLSYAFGATGNAIEHIGRIDRRGGLYWLSGSFGYLYWVDKFVNKQQQKCNFVDILMVFRCKKYTLSQVEPQFSHPYLGGSLGGHLHLDHQFL
jgi:hypothetical protein